MWRVSGGAEHRLAVMKVTLLQTQDPDPALRSQASRSFSVAPSYFTLRHDSMPSIIFSISIVLTWPWQTDLLRGILQCAEIFIVLLQYLQRLVWRLLSFRVSFTLRVLSKTQTPSFRHGRFIYTDRFYKHFVSKDFTQHHTNILSSEPHIHWGKLPRRGRQRRIPQPGQAVDVVYRQLHYRLVRYFSGLGWIPIPLSAPALGPTLSFCAFTWRGRNVLNLVQTEG